MSERSTTACPCIARPMPPTRRRRRAGRGAPTRRDRSLPSPARRYETCLIVTRRDTLECERHAGRVYQAVLWLRRHFVLTLLPGHPTYQETVITYLGPSARASNVASRGEMGRSWRPWPPGGAGRFLEWSVVTANPPLPDERSSVQTDDVHPLIDVPSLIHAYRGAAPPVVLDVRWHLAGPPGIEAYHRGHLPDAVFVDLDRDLAGPPGSAGRHPLPAASAFQEAMRRAGVSRDSLVVVYDDADSTAAGRAWWTLRYFGHRRVRGVDGGDPAWGGGGLLVAAARAGGRFRGEVEPIDPVAGHIPGAVSAPTVGNIGVDGRFLPAELLRERFAKLGATDAVDVGVFCGSGVTAAHEVLALAVAGVPAALYVGSWSNWVADAARPVAKD